MSLFHKLYAALLCSTILGMTGCVGPIGCGPGACCSPVGSGYACDGCGECEGCGELYVDPWINHPADCCDPCDRCGNYTGQSCGKCRSVFSGVKSLWGYRCGDQSDSCGDSGCGGCAIALGSTGCCDDASCGGCDSCRVGGGVLEVVREPTPAPQIVELAPGEEPYKPSRTKKIFRGRSSIASGPEESSDF